MTVLKKNAGERSEDLRIPPQLDLWQNSEPAKIVSLVLVAVSAANAGALSVSGGAKFGYAASDGNEDLETDGNRFGMQKSVGFSGSGEMDNGHTVTLTHNIAVTGSLSTSVLKYDMGDLGSITYKDTETNETVLLIKDVSIPAGSSLELLTGGKVVLQTTDVLKIDCSIGRTSYCNKPIYNNNAKKILHMQKVVEVKFLGITFRIPIQSPLSTP